MTPDGKARALAWRTDTLGGRARGSVHGRAFAVGVGLDECLDLRQQGLERVCDGKPEVKALWMCRIRLIDRCAANLDLASAPDSDDECEGLLVPRLETRLARPELAVEGPQLIAQCLEIIQPQLNLVSASECSGNQLDATA